MPNMQGFTYIDLAVLIVYLLAVLFAGLHFAKKEMKGKEYFKGDGTVPWWVTSVSIFATLLSPISFLSLAGNSYAGSWLLWFAQLGMLLAIPLTIKFFLPVYSSLDIDTAYHYLELRFNSKFLRVLGAVMFVVIQWFSCYNKVMTTDKFIYLFGRIIPALSLILSMALRFVPRFTAQLKVIRNGQKAMGRDVSEGSLFARIRHGLNMLSILVTWR